MSKVLILAGEASGDLLGANLARELLRLQPNLELSAMGGSQLRQAGVNIIVDNRSLDIIGWWEVLKNFGKIRRAMRTIKSALQNSRPDLLILIDYPGFNLRAAQWAKKLGIKVLYYVSPQIWAWKYGRIKIIRRCVDHMAVLFPFEEDLYRKEQIPVTFVGHPLSTLVRASDPPELIFQRYHLNPQHPVIAIFPGSRRQEIQRLLPIIISATRLIEKAIPNVQWVLPLASSLRKEDLNPYLTDEIRLVEKDTYNMLSICTAAIVKSGTGTLEVALSKVPLLIIYRGNLINYWLARAVVRVKQIGLCNIVAQKSIAKEFIQHDVTPENIAAETIRLVTNQAYRSNILTDLASLRENMTGKENSTKVAQIALQLL